ncbi:recQ-mediated genome instability protein 1-like [Anopheles maculipalpis]|uniref:recQ-mediated genome instability protein 1-like n=1 Tax=Anopheles maculipalpis TaxID=1496333 RepID=UPI002158C303|nr:recQ-mediated genome instability protein 1-like [Anopheles maculipalpis]
MIQNENNRAQMVKLRMVREYNIKVIDKWLSECVSFCMQENPKISNEGLFQFAFSQWLLADLNEIGLAVLPPGMDMKLEQHTMNGSFPVQMQYLIDISEPAYDQWRDLYDKKLDEAEDEVQRRKNQAPNVKKRRMLKLELTDGKQTVLAMEHSPIGCLNTKLTPGVKLLLTGPMRCVNKVIFLEPRNVRVLGGEVDVLLITNAYENVLLRVLNKPANPNPKLDYEETEVSEARNRPNHNAIQSIPMGRNGTLVAGPPSARKGIQRKSPTIVEDEVDDDSLLMGIDLDVIEATQPKPDQVPTVSTLMEDDDMDDLVQLADVRSEPEIMHHQVSSTKHSQSSPGGTVPARTKPTFDDGLFEDDIDMMNDLEDEIRNELRAYEEHQEEINPPKAKKPRPSDEYRAEQPLAETPKTPSLMSRLPTMSGPSCNEHKSTVRKEPNEPQPSTSKKFNQFNTSDLFEDSMDCAENADGFGNESSVFKILSPNYKHRIDGTNLVTIEQIMALPEAYRTDASFVVYCEVEGVTEQPRIRKEKWHLSIELTDHSNVFLPVRLHDTVISKLARQDAGALMRMRKTDREGVMKLLERILNDFKELLQDIKCFWRVVYQPDDQADSREPPVVVETYEMNEERGAILLDKIIQENCSQLRKML